MSYVVKHSGLDGKIMHAVRSQLCVMQKHSQCVAGPPVFIENVNKNNVPNNSWNIYFPVRNNPPSNDSRR